MAGFDSGVDRLIGLGDYIDYCPNTSNVLDYLCELRKETRHVFLMGNHEKFIYAMVMRSQSEWCETWLENGGEETLKSYGWDPKAVRWISENPGEAAKLWYKSKDRAFELDKNGIAEFIKSLFPKKHLDFISSLEEHYQINQFIFSHDVLTEFEKIKLGMRDQKNSQVVNIYAHYHEGLQVSFKKISIAAKHSEVGCLGLDDLSWYASDGDYLKVDRERLWSPGIDKSLEDVLKDQALGE